MMIEPSELPRFGQGCFWDEGQYWPQTASWLNMVEIEIGVLRSQCLDRRIPDSQTLASEIAACSSSVTASGARIQWECSTPSAPGRKWNGCIPALLIAAPLAADRGTSYLAPVTLRLRPRRL